MICADGSSLVVVLVRGTHISDLQPVVEQVQPDILVRLVPPRRQRHQIVILARGLLLDDIIRHPAVGGRHAVQIDMAGGGGQGRARGSISLGGQLGAVRGLEPLDVSRVAEVGGDEEGGGAGGRGGGARRAVEEAIVPEVAGKLPRVRGQRTARSPPPAAPSAGVHLHLCIQGGRVPWEAAAGGAAAVGVVVRGVRRAARGGAGVQAVITADQVREGTVVLWRGGGAGDDRGVGGAARHRGDAWAGI